MAEEIKNIDLRSEEVQDVLGEVPHWMITWGNTLIFSFVLLTLFLAWLIKYPDLVLANATITTEKPPIYVVSTLGGVVEKLVAEENAVVQSGQFLAEIENASSKENIQQLSDEIQKVHAFLNGKSLTDLNPDLILGDAQQEYAKLLSTIKEYKTFQSDPYYQNKISSLRRQISEYKLLNDMNAQEQTLGNEALILERQKLETKRKLYQEELISRYELNEAESAYKQLEQNHSGGRKNTVQNSITSIEYSKQINDLKHDQRERDKNYKFQIEQSIITLNNYVESWNKIYTISSPSPGKLSFLKRVSEKEYVSSGDTLFAVLPLHEKYLVEIRIPSAGYGKVNVGQQVNLHVVNYPYEEFGHLTGKINKLSELQNSGEYLGIVELENKLVSNYNKDFKYKPNMQASAQIVTEKRNLLQRLFSRVSLMKERS